MKLKFHILMMMTSYLGACNQIVPPPEPYGAATRSPAKRSASVSYRHQLPLLSLSSQYTWSRKAAVKKLRNRLIKQ